MKKPVLHKAALIILYGLCLSIPFSIVLVEFFAGILFVLWVVRLLTGGGVIRRSPFSFILLLFIILRLLSTIFSFDRAASIDSLGTLPLLLVFFPINSLFNRKDMERAVLILVVAVSAAAIYGSARVCFFGLDRARTTYGGYTGLSLQIVVASTFAVGFICKSRRWMIPLAVVLLIGLGACFARSQWVAGVVAGIFVVAALSARSLPYLISFLVAAVLAAPESVMRRVLETFQYGGDSSRFELWKGALSLLNRLPFMGFGPRTFADVFPKEALARLLDHSVWNYHNDFLQVAIESGWLALASLVVLWAIVFIQIGRALRARDWLRIASGGAMIGLFFASLFNGVLFDPMVMPIIGLLLAILGQKRQPELASGERILLVRTDRIGDVVLTTPMAALLKARFPGISVDMATRRYAMGAARISADIDDVLNGDLPLFAFAKDIRRRRYSAAVMVHPELKGALALALAGVKLRIGTGYRAWSPLLLTHRVMRHRGTDRHEALLNAELLIAFGIEANEIPAPNLAASERGIAFAEKALAESKRPIVVFHPGSGGSVLRCSPRIFGEAARALVADGFGVVVTGGEGDFDFVDEFLESAGGGVLNLAGKTDFEQLTGILAAADIFVAQGTGPLHIAAGFGTPVAGIYPPSRRTGPDRWRPLGSESRIIRPDLPECQRCIGARCRYFNCMDLILPEGIVKAVKELAFVKGATVQKR